MGILEYLMGTTVLSDVPPHKEVDHQKEILMDMSYLNDNKRKIDAVMVVTSQNLQLPEIVSYLGHLVNAGLQYEVDKGDILEDLRFIKIHAPQDVILYYAGVYRIDLMMNSPQYIWPVPYPKLTYLHTEITKPNSYSYIFQRSHSSSARPNYITNTERSLITLSVMDSLLSIDANRRKRYGYNRLIYIESVEDVYSLHDGTWRWKDLGNLNDRQLLYKYWATLSSVFKFQPIAMLERYFGPEVAFYFAFVGFHNEMLLALVPLAVLAFVLSFLDFASWESRDYCKLTIPICPPCSDYSSCPVRPLNDFCTKNIINLVLDSMASCIFGFFVSLWSIIYVIRWKRFESELVMRWDLNHVKYDKAVREEYEARATQIKYDQYKAKVTNNVPIGLRILGYTTTIASFAVVGVCVLGVLLLLAFYRIAVGALNKIHPTGGPILIHFTSSLIYLLFIIFVVVPALEMFARLLTHWELHQTQRDYDDALILKTSLLTMCTYYGVIIYLTLFKGIIYMFSTDVHSYIPGIPWKICQPGGCVLEAAIQVLVILLGFIFKTVFKGYNKVFFYRKWRRDNLADYGIITVNKYQARMPNRWEKDFIKDENYEYYFLHKYKDLLTTYGFITCFITIFPLVPLFEIVRSAVELRFDAFAHVVVNRKNISVRVAGIYGWNTVIMILTFPGILINACMIAFSSSFVQRILYMLRHGGSLKKYLQNSYTEYNTTDYLKLHGINTTVSSLPPKCYSPSVIMESQTNKAVLNVQLTFILVYVIGMLIFAALAMYCFSLEPPEVQERMAQEDDELHSAMLDVMQHERQESHPNVDAIVQPRALYMK